jgi:hypothetical protein
MPAVQEARYHDRRLLASNQQARRTYLPVCLFVYKDRESRDKAWAAFSADPEQAKVHKEMNVPLKAKDVFTSATDYSPMK